MYMINMKLNFESKFSYVDKRKGLVLPEYMGNELAEFLGILVGDGYIGEYRGKGGLKKRRIEIAGHSVNDKEHLIYTKSLFKELFNLDVNVQERSDQNTSRIEIDSMGLFNFL